MVTYSPQSAAPYPDQTPPEKDGSGNAPENGAQETATLQERLNASEASEKKAKSDLSSLNGRYQKLRRDVETGALGQSNSSSSVFGQGMIELAQAIDPEGKTEVTTRIKALVSESNQSAAEQRQSVRESGYEATMTKLVSDHGLENNPVVKQAADAYREGKTDSDLRDAVDMVRDEALTVAAAKAEGKLPFVTPPEKPGVPVPEPAPDGNPADVNLNPSSGGSMGMPTSGRALLEQDINNMDYDQLQNHKAELLAAKKKGDFYPNLNFG